MVSTTTQAVDTFGDDGADVLDQIPKVVEKVDFVGLESEAEGDATKAEDSAAEQVEAPARKLYFVRIPRPPIDNSSDKLTKLTEGFQAHVAKIKKVNAKVQAKREEMRELRKQMSAARSLKGESQPEYEEKLTRLKQLQELRNSYQSKMSEIRNALKGLDCKSEAELDAKIKEMEDKIAHDANIELRDEKDMVKKIATLRSQRDRIKEYDNQKASMAEMEVECNKIKAVIQDMDGEFSILKGERDSAQKIISDIYTKLTVAEKELKEVEEEQADATKAKNDALEKLDQARDAMNSGMKPYRENRKFSMQVRDMVSAGQVEEAFAMCEAQADEMIATLSGDKAFLTNYNKLWSEQRRTPVAEILPNSAPSSANASSKSRSGDAPRAVANGAEKAKSLIANLLAEASKEVAEKKEEQARTRAMEPAAAYEADEDADDEGDRQLTPGEILTAKVEAEAKMAGKKSREAVSYVSNPAAKAAEVFGGKVELPSDNLLPEFVLPEAAAPKKEEDALSKEQIRAEQMAKAKEAEERKQRKLKEAEEKKVKAAEKAKQAEIEAKAAAAAARAAAEKKASADAAAKAAKAAEAAAKAAEEEADAASRGVTINKDIKNIYAKTTTVATAKRPVSKDPMKQFKKYIEQNQKMVGIAFFLVSIIFILIVASFM